MSGKGAELHVQNCTLKLGMHVNLKTGKKQSTDGQYTVKLTP